MIKIITTSLLIYQLLALSGSTISSYCHCDLIPSFCDIGCCCDSFCSSVSANCYNLKSKSFCPDPTYFQRLGSTYLNPNGCFYYNSTNTIIEEISLPTRTTTSIISQNLQAPRVSISNKPIWAGYLFGDILNVSGNPNLNLLKDSGNCMSGTDTIINLRFGANMNLYCSCPSCTTVPSLFSAFSSKTINQFKTDVNRTLTLPSFTDGSITSVQINFIVGTYGSSKIKYIQRFTYSTSNSGVSDRRLIIKFIEASQISPSSLNAPFFPQIPSDIFYPIYLLS